MPTTTPASLSPRKRPRQARSAATLDAIFEATIQVLLADGMRTLTTTRVAERAGVSVGTMYQYFPHKQSLIHALTNDTSRCWRTGSRRRAGRNRVGR